MSERVKINFKLERSDDDYPPADWETMWAIVRGDGCYEIDNVPFFVRGLSAGDLVSVSKQGDGSLVYSSHVEASGHSTFRIFATAVEDVAQIQSDLCSFGAECETSHIPRLIAVHLDQECSLEPVMDYLRAGEQAGKFDYEEAAVRHHLD